MSSHLRCRIWPLLESQTWAGANVLHEERCFAQPALVTCFNAPSNLAEVAGGKGVVLLSYWRNLYYRITFSNAKCCSAPVSVPYPWVSQCNSVNVIDGKLSCVMVIIKSFTLFSWNQVFFFIVNPCWTWIGIVCNYFRCHHASGIYRNLLSTGVFLNCLCYDPRRLALKVAWNRHVSNARQESQTKL